MERDRLVDSSSTEASHPRDDNQVKQNSVPMLVPL
jgi:hypothetical protein